MKHLGRIFALVKVNGEKAVVSWKIDRVSFACREEVRDVLHLRERHVIFLELDTWRRQGKVGKSAEHGQPNNASDGLDSNPPAKYRAIL